MEAGIAALDTSEAPERQAPSISSWQIGLDTYVRCVRYNVLKMRVVHCLERQGARWPGRNKCGDGSLRAKRAAIYDYCGSGECEQGKRYRAAVPADFVPDVVRNPGHIFYKPDLGEQRRKMRKAWLSNPDWLPVDEEPERPADALDLEDPDVKLILGGG